ncbi:retrovirus-related pol polyprotein from transposon TNT 1-94 [Tanacetum coccineum]
MENLNEVRVKKLKSDNGTEFKSHKLEEFCDEKEEDLLISVFSYVFGYPIHIHNHKDHLGKFDEKVDDGFFLGYSLVAKAFRMFNIRRQEMEETIHVSVTFEDPIKFTEADDHPALNEPDQTESADHFEPVEPQNNVIIEPINRWSREKHIELVNIIGEPLADITTKSRIRDSDAASASECLYVNFLSEMEPKRLIEALKEEGWIIAMQKEPNQFKRNKNKERLVAQGYNQLEEIDYEQTFAPVARMGAIRIFLAYAAYMGFMVYQMDVKRAFLNGKISKEYDLADRVSVKCPMLPPNNLGPNKPGVSVNDTLFRGMIGSLMYQLNPHRNPTLFAIKGIFKFSKNSKFGLMCYTKGVVRYFGGNVSSVGSNKRKKTMFVDNVSVKSEYVRFCVHTMLNGHTGSRVNWLNFDRLSWTRLLLQDWKVSGNVCTQVGNLFRLTPLLLYSRQGSHLVLRLLVLYWWVFSGSGWVLGVNMGAGVLGVISAWGDALWHLTGGCKKSPKQSPSYLHWGYNALSFTQDEFLSVMGPSYLLGRPIKMDQMTAEMCKVGSARLGFARVLVEINAEKPFLDSVEINCLRDSYGMLETLQKAKLELLEI